MIGTQPFVEAVAMNQRDVVINNGEAIADVIPLVQLSSFLGFQRHVIGNAVQPIKPGNTICPQQCEHCGCQQELWR